uniref:Uncharacterized protein n=1 Tax=Rhizophora mucronata TaxID=61149 RepID=A0A2P2QZE9_RHIMU
MLFDPTLVVAMSKFADGFSMRIFLELPLATQ